MDYDREFLTGTVGVLILSLLTEREMYGYEIVQEAERRSAQTLQLERGHRVSGAPSDGARGSAQSHLARRSHGARAQVLRVDGEGSSPRGVEAQTVGEHLVGDARHSWRYACVIKRPSGR